MLPMGVQYRLLSIYSALQAADGVLKLWRSHAPKGCTGAWFESYALQQPGVDG